MTKELLQILILFVSQKNEGIKFSKNVIDRILDNKITILEGDAARISQDFIALMETESYIKMLNRYQ